MSASSPRSAPPLAGRGLATLALVALAVVAGIADLHLHDGGPAGDVLGHLGAVPERGETIFRGASHPAEAPHAESAGAETHFRCPVCALHLQAADEAGGDALAGRVPPSSALGGRPAAVLASSAPFRPGGPRAPPSR